MDNNFVNSFRKYYKDTIRENFIKVFPNLIVNGIAFVVVYSFASFACNYSINYIDRMEGANNKILLKTLSTTFFYFVIFSTILFILVNFGFNLNTVLVLLGSAGLAIALSLKDSISNVSSGMMILLLEYFNIGDLIEVNGTTGYVQEFNLLVTSLRDSNGVLINIPNNTIVNGVLTNYTKNKNLSVYFYINVSNYDQTTDIKDLSAKIVSLLKEKSTFATNKDQIKVIVNDMSKEGTLLKIKIPIESKNFIAAKDEGQMLVRELIKNSKVNLVDYYYKDQPK